MRFSLALYPEEFPELMFYDAKGRKRIALGAHMPKHKALQLQSLGFWLYDALGLTRMSFALDFLGSPQLELSDSTGRWLFKAP
jgi:hypothetical protein